MHRPRSRTRLDDNQHARSRGEHTHTCDKLDVVRREVAHAATKLTPPPFAAIHLHNLRTKAHATLSIPAARARSLCAPSLYMYVRFRCAKQHAAIPPLQRKTWRTHKTRVARLTTGERHAQNKRSTLMRCPALNGRSVGSSVSKSNSATAWRAPLQQPRAGEQFGLNPFAVVQRMPPCCFSRLRFMRRWSCRLKHTRARTWSVRQ